jgi:hypothetical protein
MVVLGWLLGNVFFPAILLLLFATIRVFGFPWGNPLGKLRVFWNALVSWCSYNNDNLTLPGLLPSPAGSTGARVATAALSVILVGSTFTLYLYSDSLAAHATTKVHDSTPTYNVPAVTAGDHSVSPRRKKAACIPRSITLEPTYRKFLIGWEPSIRSMWHLAPGIRMKSFRQPSI